MCVDYAIGRFILSHDSQPLKKLNEVKSLREGNSESHAHGHLSESSKTRVSVIAARAEEVDFASSMHCT